MTNTQHTATKVTYSKFFLTGTLAGLSVRCEFTVPADSANDRMMGLQKITKDNPSKDYGTRAEFYVYNVGCEWLAGGR